jgi:hypothetical protein
MVGHFDVVLFLLRRLVMLRLINGDNSSAKGAITHERERPNRGGRVWRRMRSEWLQNDKRSNRDRRNQDDTD